MEEKDEGISIGEIFHVIFIRKWLLLAVAIFIALVGVIFVQAFYNPSKAEYHATFQIRFPNRDTEKYPDGTEFLYQEFVSLENLQAVRDSNEDFASINVESMKRRSDVSITEMERMIDNIPTNTGIYTIYIMKKYFKSSSQAIDFFTALISLPAEKVVEKSKSIDFDRYLKQYNLVNDYTSKLDVLIRQKDLIIEGYDKFVEEYSNVHTITITLPDGSTVNKTLNAEQSDVESYFTANDLEAMKAEVAKYGYMPENSEYLTVIENNILKLELEEQENNLKLVALEEQLEKLRKLLEGKVTETAYQDIITSMSSLVQRNAEIEHEKEKYQIYKDSNKKPVDYDEAFANFQKNLDAHYKKLVEFTNNYGAFNYELYETNTKVLVSAGSIIVETGGYSILIVLAVFLVAGLVVGCGMNLVLDLPKYLREKKNGKPEDPKEEENPTISE